MSQKTRVTMRAIGEAAGVSHATVSMALRNHAKIPEATRLRIQKLADKMGYRPDPVLSALGAYTLSRRPAHYRATLAWVDIQPKENLPTHKNPRLESFYSYQDACAQAEKTGYRLEPFCPIQMGVSPERFSRILRSRKIQGIILPPLPRDFPPFEMNWDWFSVVALGLSHSARFDTVCSAQYRNARLAIRNLQRLGYRKIALITLDDLRKRTDMNFCAGAWAEGEESGCKVYLCDLPEWPDNKNRPQLQKWLQKNQPDAILGPSLLYDELLANGYLADSGKAFASLGVIADNNPLRLAGLDQCARPIGTAAVRQLTSLIYRNELGVPAQPFQILIDGIWLDGKSAPQKA